MTQEQRQTLEYISRAKGGLLQPEHKAAIRACLAALTEAEKKAKAFDAIERHAWSSPQHRYTTQSWEVYNATGMELLGEGKTLLAAVQDAMSKEGGK